MTCNCNNNTNQSELRIVRGNDFTTLYRLTAKYVDGTVVPDFDLQQCTEVNVIVRRRRGDVSNSKGVEFYGTYRLSTDNTLKIDWDGLLMKVGTYTVDFSAKYEGVDIRCYSTTKLVFDIVETNEYANIPEGTFIEDGTYQLDGDFVLVFGTQQQADWEQTDPNHPAYIKNKPEGIDTRDLLRKDEAADIYLAKADTNIFSDEDVDKLATIPTRGQLNSVTRNIDFYDENGVLGFSVDATAMLKDGSILNIVYENGYISFIFNSDAEKEPISIYIGDVFESAAYYNKTQTDLKYVTYNTLLDYYTKTQTGNLLGGKQDTINDLSAIRSGASAGATAYQKPSTGIPSSDLAEGVIPDVSQFITKTVDDLTNYYTKSQTYTQTEVQQLINAVKQFTYELVNILPTASATTMNKIYLVPSSDPHTQNVKDEYITIQNGSTYSWEQIGSTAIDLSGYITTTALNNALADYTTTADLNTLLAGYQTKIDSTHKLNYSLISNTPTKVSDFTNDSGFITTETDPVFSASPAYGITSNDIEKWDAAAVVADDDGMATIPDFDAYADTVWNKAQTLSSAQKSQARTNIGAQEALVSGSNIKTINNEPILGSGNIIIPGGGGSGVQSDWNETDTTSEAYILNKPSVISAEFSYDSTNEALVITPANAAVYDSVTETLTIL